MFARTVLPLIALAACQEATLDSSPPTPRAGIHAVGDSIMASFAEEGASIADVVSEARGESVANVSVGGALMTLGDPERPAIPDQYREGDWSWLIVDGGGNDLGELCGCDGCDDVLDSLVTSDGRGGVFPRFVGPIAQSGVRVALMGYPDLPDDAAFGFDACDDEFEVLAQRLTTLATFDARIDFIDMRDVISSTDLDMYVDDHVHPSLAGAATMGAYLVERMAAAEAGGEGSN
ncbi:MAG: SGNH/GDSL hydrolase family protein [Myxococcota bacterium]